MIGHFLKPYTSLILTTKRKIILHKKRQEINVKVNIKNCLPHLYHDGLSVSISLIISNKFKNNPDLFIYLFNYYACGLSNFNPALGVIFSSRWVLQLQFLKNLFMNSLLMYTFFIYILYILLCLYMHVFFIVFFESFAYLCYRIVRTKMWT